MLESITLNAPDISCEHCQHAIEGTLGKLEGVNLARVDIARRTVLVNYDAQKLTQEHIEATLDDLGYTITK